MFSMSMDEIHSPADLITSLARSVMACSRARSRCGDRRRFRNPGPCRRRTIGLEITLRHGGHAHSRAQTPCRREAFSTLVVDDSSSQRRRNRAWLVFSVIWCRTRRPPERDACCRWCRPAHLGHAPAVNDSRPCVEGFVIARERGEPPMVDALQRLGHFRLLLDMREHRDHTVGSRRHGHLLGLDQLPDRRPSSFAPGKHQLAPTIGHRNGRATHALAWHSDDASAQSDVGGPSTSASPSRTRADWRWE